MMTEDDEYVADIRRKLSNRPPWETEPDHEAWTTAAGLPGVIHRHPTLGNLCGYVGVRPTHPLWKQSCDAAIDVHGGVTYTGPAIENFTRGHWWIGFDCAHYGDYSPGLAEYNPSDDCNRTYRDWDYVKQEVESLARQLADLAQEEEA